VFRLTVLLYLDKRESMTPLSCRVAFLCDLADRSLRLERRRLPSFVINIILIPIIIVLKSHMHKSHYAWNHIRMESHILLQLGFVDSPVRFFPVPLAGICHGGVVDSLVLFLSFLHSYFGWPPNDFDDVQWKAASKEEWHRNFDYLFPPKGVKLGGTVQNYNTVSYYPMWQRMMDRMTDDTIKVARRQIWIVFKSLFWMPAANANRIWETKLSKTFSKSSGYPDNTPAPKILLNGKNATPEWVSHIIHCKQPLNSVEEAP
jgi:hypothetical protein